MATCSRVRGRALVWLAAAAFAVVAVSRPRAAADTDLDAFMREVLARRDDNWKKLQQYVLDEHEAIELTGPSRAPLWGERRDYTWYIRDGFFVRSPVRFNGVAISEGERRKYEEDFLRRVQERERRAQRGADRNAPAASTPDDAPRDLDTLIRQTRQPEFISSAYFLRFRFDEGRYALVGREMLDGRDVLRIEYYPSKLFAQPQGRSSPGGRGRQDRGQQEQLRAVMNKASLVTLWVEQPTGQIVKYTFDNVTSNFIPANWLGRVTSAHASMTMGQPFPDVWLPHGLEMAVALTLAVGDLDFRYTLDYSDYRRAETSSTLHVPAIP